MTEKTISIIFLVLLPPLLPGIINKTKAVMAGRKGAPLLQPWFDIIKLMRKGVVISTSTSWIFQAGPMITLVSVFMAGLLLPPGPFGSVLSFQGDIILFAYLFGLSRFFTTAAALDTGSAFEGMGSAREVSFAILSEPALFLALCVLVKKTGTLSMNEILQGPVSVFQSVHTASLVFTALGLFIVLLAETCRIPVDDPNTHLELTMIHEVMVLDHSGPLLGMVLYSSAQKLFILGSMLLHLVFPYHTGNPWTDTALFLFKLIILSVSIGILESVMARLRMRRVTHLLAGAVILCGSGLILLMR